MNNKPLDKFDSLNFETIYQKSIELLASVTDEDILLLRSKVEPRFVIVFDSMESETILRLVVIDKLSQEERLFISSLNNFNYLPGLHSFRDKIAIYNSLVS